MVPNIIEVNMITNFSLKCTLEDEFGGERIYEKTWNLVVWFLLSGLFVIAKMAGLEQVREYSWWTAFYIIVTPMILCFLYFSLVVFYHEVIK